MVYRLLKAGREVAYSPELVVHHAHNRDSEAYLRTRRAYRAGRTGFLVKHILRGDVWLLKRLRWDLGDLLRDLTRADTRCREKREWIERLRLFQSMITAVLLRSLYEITRPLVRPLKAAPRIREWVRDAASEALHE
jgi:hypothetical protein